ncbi:unnamed protein product, partial [Linum tenue]
TEIIFLGQLSHPHLVKLIGYCREEEHRLLVYQYMPCGSLENHLFTRKGHGASLQWSTRMKIALGAAKGLQFLHDSQKPVIYRDFKASNILLDSDCHLTSRSDVYSFGVVLLELLTGRRSVDKARPQREQNLVAWARPILSSPRRMSRIMDPRLDGQYSETGARKAATLAYRCLSLRPRHRPKMSYVVRTLEPLKDYKDFAMGTFIYEAQN